MMAMRAAAERRCTSLRASRDPRGLVGLALGDRTTNVVKVTRHTTRRGKSVRAQAVVER